MQAGVASAYDIGRVHLSLCLCLSPLLLCVGRGPQAAYYCSMLRNKLVTLPPRTHAASVASKEDGTEFFMDGQNGKYEQERARKRCLCKQESRSCCMGLQKCLLFWFFWPRLVTVLNQCPVWCVPYARLCSEGSYPYALLDGC